ncbi:DUF167 domain-containing protein [Ottowia testudinis]|uniref:UPF0235 protein J1M35_08480 n=1 Tax=Ottowia testudinis TaxID=2816950 RepID=A0A975H514_9BURK|nr:DUF167 domain-containing protein [Ottowia testudinis]QTD46891.1 DUF167 domain-containing protein [Ottowia testudinis]
MAPHLLKLAIHATPGAKRTEAAGAHGDALRVRLGAPPVDGKANAALISWAAGAFGVPKKQVELLHGAAGRQKVLGVRFDSAAELTAAQALVAHWRALGAADGAPPVAQSL